MLAKRVCKIDSNKFSVKWPSSLSVKQGPFCLATVTALPRSCSVACSPSASGARLRRPVTPLAPAATRPRCTRNSDHPAATPAGLVARPPAVVRSAALAEHALAVVIHSSAFRISVRCFLILFVRYFSRLNFPDPTSSYSIIE